MNRIVSTMLALIVLAFTASAQVGPKDITLSTNRVTAATTNTTAGTGFFVGSQKTVNILLTCYSTNLVVPVALGDAAATFTVRFAGSMDGTTYFENGTNWDVLYVTAQTNSTATYHQLDSSGVQYFRQNKMLLPTTNLVIYPTATYWYK